MKELQKYYAHNEDLSIERPVDIEWGSQEHVYLASEADAVFATLQWERDGSCVRIMVLEDQAEKDRDFIAQQSHGFADAIREREERHAEEIERLKAERDLMEKHWQISSDSLERATRSVLELRKQAERYEKLRRLNPQQFLELWKTNLMGPRFDDLVDQLPASGEAPAPRKGSYGQECNRTACHQSPATWHNRETLRYYCEPCGKLINANNRDIDPPLCSAPPADEPFKYGQVAERNKEEIEAQERRVE